MPAPETEPIDAPWHVGTDGKAHYLWQGRPLCGAPGVNSRCPKQERTLTENGTVKYKAGICQYCRDARGELRK